MADFSNRVTLLASKLSCMTTTNRQLLEHAFAAYADGNPAPFLACLADDVAWTVTGSTAFSRTYAGKKTVEDQLRHPFTSRLATPLRLVAQRILSDGDYVIVECRGHAQTKAGGVYDNSYCMVFRFANGVVRELTEYMDTAHVLATFAPRMDRADA